MENKISIFISTPISGFENETDYFNYREVVVSLIKELRQSYSVCSEVEQITGLSTYDSPDKSIQEDFESIKNSDVFLFLHPLRMQSSSLIELGYAIALGKKIVIVGKKCNLPYLAVGIENFSSHAVIVDANTISSDYFNQIYTAIKNVLI